MGARKNTKVDFTDKVKSTIKTAKSSAKKANEIALNTTEEVVIETINIASQWQKITEKAVKGGIQLLDNQQNLVFDVLESYKKHFVNGKKKLNKVFS